MPTLGEMMHLSIGTIHDRTATEDRRTEVAIADFVDALDLVQENAEPYDAALEIADFMTDAINTGKLAHGAKLQSRDVLAKKFRVTTITLNRAFTTLKTRGKVVTKGASGTFVVGPNAPRSQQ